MPEAKTYTVVEVTGQKEWQGAYGPMKDYYLTLRNEAGATRERVQLAQKPSTPPPSPGQSLELTVEADGQGRLKAKKVQPPGGRPQGFSGPRPRDPKEQASMVRCHAQKVAAELVISAAGAKALGTADAMALLKEWANLLTTDVEQYVAKAGQP
jgi:hypothetical protein